MRRLSYEDVMSNFYYDESSPSCLRWGTVIFSGNARPMTTIGSVAGSFKDRYYTVQIFGKKYFCHKLIYLLHGMKLAVREKIDHFDRNQKNNRFSNLRVCTQKTNCENRRISSANSSGVTGVSFSEKEGNTYCVAHWKVDRKTRSKLFSVKKLGLLPAFRLAVICRNENIQLLNAAGANYTEVHGKETNE